MTTPVTNRQRGSSSWPRRVLRKLLIVGILTIGGLVVISVTAPIPENLGVRQGRLARLPESPNGVSSQAERESQKVSAVQWSEADGDPMVAIESIMLAMPRTKLLVAEPDYRRFTVRSFLFRFVDDVEFYYDRPRQQIHFRSAARVGYSDMGVNLKRIETVIAALEKRQLANRP